MSDASVRRLIADEDNHVLTVLWDVDGVLADISHRIGLCPGRPGVENEDWDEYHARASEDVPVPGNVALARLLHQGGYNNVLVTNRPESNRLLTEWWLDYHKVPYSHMFMREDQAHHGSKEWVIERLHLPTTVLAVEDDARHLEMYARYGIPGFYVHSGYYEGITHEQYFSSNYVPHGGEASEVVKQGGAARVTELSLSLAEEKQAVVFGTPKPSPGTTWRGIALQTVQVGDTVEVRILGE